MVYATRRGRVGQANIDQTPSTPGSLMSLSSNPSEEDPDLASTGHMQPGLPLFEGGLVDYPESDAESEPRRVPNSDSDREPNMNHPKDAPEDEGLLDFLDELTKTKELSSIRNQEIKTTEVSASASSPSKAPPSQPKKIEKRKAPSTPRSIKKGKRVKKMIQKPVSVKKSGKSAPSASLPTHKGKGKGIMESDTESDDESESLEYQQRRESFASRQFIEERLVDMESENQWGYPPIIERGGLTPTVTELASYSPAIVSEFYAMLPSRKDKVSEKGVRLRLRGKEYLFSSQLINECLGLQPLSDEEEKKDVDGDGVGKDKLAKVLTEGKKTPWSDVNTTILSPRFAALLMIAAHNWIPSSHKNHISLERAQLLFKMFSGIRVDFGKMVYRQVMDLAVLHRNDSRWLMFPRVIYAVLQMQHPLSLQGSDVFIKPILYKKDSRSGEAFIKQEKFRSKFGPSSTKPAAKQNEVKPGELYTPEPIRMPSTNPTRAEIHECLSNLSYTIYILSGVIGTIRDRILGGEEDEVEEEYEESG